MKSLPTLLLAVAAGASTLNASTFTLKGDFLEVGIGSGGTLIDDGFISGIKYDGSGRAGAFGSLELLRAGTPWEYYAISIEGVSLGIAAFPFGNTYGFNTFNTSVGSDLSATTLGSVGGLAYESIISFNESSRVINFALTFENTSLTTPVSNIYFARGFDPDPDDDLGGSYETINYFSRFGDRVTADGPLSGLSISLADLTGLGMVSISDTWGGTEDPVQLYLNPPGDDGRGDNSLNVAYYIPTLNPGDSVTLNFEYAVVPEPQAYGFGFGALSLVSGILLRRRQTPRKPVV